MNKFKSVFKRELKYMWGISYIKVIIFIMLYIGLNIMMGISSGTHMKEYHINFFYHMFKGIGYIEDINNIGVPILWLLVNVVIIYFVGDSVQKGYDSNSIYVVVRSSKRKFWLSQVIVSLIMVTIYYSIIFFITFFVGKIFVDSKSLNLDWDIIVLYVTTSMMIVMFSNFAGLLFDFKYGFLIITMLLILSFLGESSFLPGQQSLILRHAPYDMKHNLTVMKSLIYNLVLGITFFIMGLIISDKKEIR